MTCSTLLTWAAGGAGFGLVVGWLVYLAWDVAYARGRRDGAEGGGAS